MSLKAIILQKLANEDMDGFNLASLPEELRDDIDIVFPMIKDKNYAYLFASERLKHDKKILAYVLSSRSILELCLPDDVRNDKNIFLKSLQEYQCSDSLYAISNALKEDRSFIWECSRLCRGSIRYASQTICSDYEFIKDLTKNCIYVFEYINPTLIDKELVLIALRNAHVPIKYLSHDLRNDKEIMIKAINVDYKSAEYLSCELLGDYEMVKHILFCANRSGYTFANIKKYFVINLLVIQEIEDCVKDYDCNHFEALDMLISWKKIAEQTSNMSIPDTSFNFHQFNGNYSFSVWLKYGEELKKWLLDGLVVLQE